MENDVANNMFHVQHAIAFCLFTVCTYLAKYKIHTLNDNVVRLVACQINLMQTTILQPNHLANTVESCSSIVVHEKRMYLAVVDIAFCQTY